LDTFRSAGGLPERRLADPELVDQHVPVRVEPIVAYPGGEDRQVEGVVQRHPRRLVGEFVVDGGPASCGCGGIAWLGCQCALGLGRAAARGRRRTAPYGG